LENIFG